MTDLKLNTLTFYIFLMYFNEIVYIGGLGRAGWFRSSEWVLENLQEAQLATPGAPPALLHNQDACCHTFFKYLFRLNF